MMDFLIGSVVLWGFIATICIAVPLCLGGFQWIGKLLSKLVSRWQKPPISQEEYAEYFKVLSEFGEIQYQHNEPDTIYTTALLPVEKDKLFEMIKTVALWDSLPENRSAARAQLMQLHKFQDIEGAEFIQIADVEADPVENEKNKLAVQNQKLQVIQMFRLAQELAANEK